MEDFMLTEQERATLQFKVTTKLREVIMKGDFELGERLVQEEWARKLGVSRMPIREALRQLEVEGLVKLEPRKGAIVTPISSEDIEEIYQLRALVEGEAVEQSLPYLDEKEKEQIINLYKEMDKLGKTEKDREAYQNLNTDFHKMIQQGCPWRRLHNFIDTLWRGIPLHTPSLLDDNIDKSHEEHQMMVGYIEKNDKKNLRYTMEKHILRTKDLLIDIIPNK